MKSVRYVFLGILALAWLLGALLYGNNIALLNPKGLISGEQTGLIAFSILLLLVITVPTIFILYFVAWRYRETNKKAIFAPETRHSKKVDVLMWALPTAFMFILTLVMFQSTHKLEPQKAIASDVEPLRIQVIAQRWKWVFLYPEQNIATVNYLQLPTDRPVEFKITADESPMASFWIPNLGGMLYAMTGHVNTLNLKADTPGDYPGSSGEISGSGFAGMRFTARVGSADDFEDWVSNVKQTRNVLDNAAYAELLKPSESNPPAYYSAYDEVLYDKVLMKYDGHDPAAGGHSHEAGHSTDNEATHH